MCIVRFQHQIPWSDLRNYINTYPSYTYKLRWGISRNINLEPDYGKRTDWLTHKQNMSRYWIQHKLYKATKFLSQIKVHVTPKFIFYNKPNILHYVQTIWQIRSLRPLSYTFFCLHNERYIDYGTNTIILDTLNLPCYHTINEPGLDHRNNKKKHINYS